MTNDVAPAQCRAARAYLRWGRRDLADRARISENTVYNFEEERAHTAKPETRAAIRRAFEEAGIEFNGGDLVLPFEKEAGP